MIQKSLRSHWATAGTKINMVNSFYLKTQHGSLKHFQDKFNEITYLILDIATYNIISVLLQCYLTFSSQSTHKIHKQQQKTNNSNTIINNKSCIIILLVANKMRERV